jgi:hypothetical protein
LALSATAKVDHYEVVIATWGGCIREELERHFMLFLPRPSWVTVKQWQPLGVGTSGRLFVPSEATSQKTKNESNR